MPLVLLMPATQAVRMTMARNAGRREGAQVGISMELYRREHGDWPEWLEQLSPQWLPKVPIDRINGGPLGYCTSTEGVIVYSFGSDTDNDNGRPPETQSGHGRLGQYNILPPSPIIEDTSSLDVRKRDGDWVIWSTVSSNAEIELQNAD